jgi:hypothetical protein
MIQPFWIKETIQFCFYFSAKTKSEEKLTLQNEVQENITQRKKTHY